MDEKDYYFCYHIIDGIEGMEQTVVKVGEEAPRCPICHEIMTYGRWTKDFENGGKIFTTLYLKS